MAPLSNEEFLCLCMKHMKGQVDLKAVAEESGAKETAVRVRWNRYKAKLKASATATGTGDADGDNDKSSDGTGTPKKTPKKHTAKKQVPAKKATPKKRKLGGDDAGESKINGEDDDSDD